MFGSRNNSRSYSPFSLRLPRFEYDSVPYAPSVTMEDLPITILVQYAGQDTFNGTYEADGETNGRPRYIKIEDRNKVIRWSGSQWDMFDQTDGSGYDSSDDVESPLDIEEWTAKVADLGPMPTVSEAGCGEDYPYDRRNLSRQII